MSTSDLDTAMSHEHRNFLSGIHWIRCVIAVNNFTAIKKHSSATRTQSSLPGINWIQDGIAVNRVSHHNTKQSSAIRIREQFAWYQRVEWGQRRKYAGLTHD